MPIASADLQSAIDAAMAERVKAEFGQLFNGMFTGRKDKPEAIATFKRGVGDFIEAHAEASKVIIELFPEQKV